MASYMQPTTPPGQSLRLSCRHARNRLFMNAQKQLDLSVLYVEDENATRDEILFLKRRVTKLTVASNGQEGWNGSKRIVQTWS